MKAIFKTAWFILRESAWPTLARCRWCDDNRVPIRKMAVFSWKRSYGGFTGVCKKCIGSDAREAAYHERMEHEGKIAKNWKP